MNDTSSKELPGTPEHMLETLKLCYQHALDGAPILWTKAAEKELSGLKRLSDAEGRDLGRRLAFYWSYNK
jgi:hypothetical protein